MVAGVLFEACFEAVVAAEEEFFEGFEVGFVEVVELACGDDFLPGVFPELDGFACVSEAECFGIARGEDDGVFLLVLLLGRGFDEGGECGAREACFVGFVAKGF